MTEKFYSRFIQSRIVASHPSLEKSEGWGTLTRLAGQGWATRLAKETPAGRKAERADRANGNIVSMPRLGGLHHRYDLAA
jgi:hypothetical protein